MKRIIIISNLKHIHKLRPFSKNATFIATNPIFEKNLENLGLKFNPIRNYLKFKKFITLYAEGEKFIRNWIKKNPAFNKLLSYKGLHLFDLMECNLTLLSDYYYYYYSMTDIINIIDILKAILNKEKPDQVLAIDDHNLTTEILKKLTKTILIKSTNLTYYKNTFLIPILSKQIIKIKLLKGRIFTLFKKPNPKGKIIALAAGHNYIVPILPLIKAMKEDMVLIKPLIIKDNDKITNLLKRENIPFTLIENFWDRNLAALVKYHTKRLNQNLKILLKDKTFASSFIYKDVPIFDIFKKILNNLFIKRGKILEMIINIELNKKILEQIKPKLVIVVEEQNLPSKVMIKLAKSQKIKTLLMQHGFINKNYAKSNPILSDKSFVWGKNFKKILLDYNKNKKNDILITGRLSENKNYNRELTFKKLNIPLNKKLVLLATSKIAEIEDRELILETLQATRSLKDVQLVIRPHPMEDGILQKRLAKLTKTNPIILKDIDLDELIDASDLIITYASSVGLFAINHRKPLIIANFAGKENEFDYVKSGVALGVYDPKDLKNSIKTLLYNSKEKEKLLKKAKTYATKHIDSEGEESLRKTIRIIKQIIN